MGSAISANLVKAGFVVYGFDIDSKARARLEHAGGQSLGSTSAVATQTRVLLTSLPSLAAFRSVVAELTEQDQGGLIVIETSTLPIAEKELARKQLAKSGAILLDCPLSGTGAQARTRDLSVYASGPKSAIAKVTKVFEGFARIHYNVGAFGAGSKLKFIANLLVAIHNVSSAEAVVMGLKAGIDPDLLVQVIGSGAGSSRMLQIRGPMMARADYNDATMKVELWQKDMQIITDFARELGTPTPLFSATVPIYNAAMAQGFGMQDTGAVCAVIEGMAGLKARTRKRSNKS